MNAEDIDTKIAAQKKLVESSQAQVSVPSRQEMTVTWWSVTNAMTISAVVLLFGLIVLLLATYLIRIGKSSESVLRIFGTVLIIVIAVFLVVAGYTSDQIAPVMGLLGTVAGYLLGKDSSPKVAAELKHEDPGGKAAS